MAGLGWYLCSRLKHNFLKIASGGAILSLNATDTPSPSHTGQCFEMLAHKFQYC